MFRLCVDECSVATKFQLGDLVILRDLAGRRIVRVGLFHGVTEAGVITIVAASAEQGKIVSLPLQNWVSSTKKRGRVRLTFRKLNIVATPAFCEALQKAIALKLGVSYNPNKYVLSSVVPLIDSFVSCHMFA